MSGFSFFSNFGDKSQMGKQALVQTKGWVSDMGTGQFLPGTPSPSNEKNKQTNESCISSICWRMWHIRRRIAQFTVKDAGLTYLLKFPFSLIFERGTPYLVENWMHQVHQLSLQQNWTPLRACMFYPGSKKKVFT